LALSSAPRLVVARILALARLLQALHAFLGVGVVLGLDRQRSERALRSALMMIAETSSPSFSTLRASSTRSRLISEARR
jgi:hypothetical protein